MKSLKLFPFILIVLFMCLGADLFAEQQIIPLENARVEGAVESPVLIENYRGELFFLFEQNGRLGCKRSFNGGASFEDYPLDISLENVKDIILFNQFHTIWNVFVVAEYNGAENIFYFTLNNMGDFGLAHNGPIGEHSTGTITDLQATKGHLDEHIVSYLQDGRLKLVAINPVNNDYTQISVNAGDEKVTDYYIELHFVDDENPIYRGYYVAQGIFSGKRLTYFEVERSGTVRTDFVTDGLESIDDFNFLNEQQDTIGFIYKKGSRLSSIVRANGVRMTPFETEMPFSDFSIRSKVYDGEFYFHTIVDDEGLLYLDYDSTFDFKDPLLVSPVPIKGMPYSFMADDGTFNGIAFIEASSPPRLHVKQLDTWSTAVAGEVQMTLPGGMVDCVYLKNDNRYLASFEIDGIVSYYIGTLYKSTGQIEWTLIEQDDWGGGFTGTPPDRESISSELSCYSVYPFGDDLFVLNKENPGLSRFYDDGLYFPYAVEGRETVGILSGQPVKNTLFLVDREVR